MFRLTVAPDIEIKLLEPADAEAVFAAVDRDREYLREWLPWVDSTHSLEDVRHFIEEVVSRAVGRITAARIVASGWMARWLAQSAVTPSTGPTARAASVTGSNPAARARASSLGRSARCWSTCLTPCVCIAW